MGSITDSYCWVTGTYTQKPYGEKGYESGSVKHHCDPRPDYGNEDCWHHEYYQWIALVLILQAACFYVPRYVYQFF